MDENLAIPTSPGLADGTHYLYIRTQNADGEWSLYERQEFEVDGTLGINTEDIAAIKIFPNPTSNYLNISLPNNNYLKSAIIYDLNGKEIFKTNNNLEKIDLSRFQSGTYLLLLETEKGNKSLKIIKN